MTSKVTKQSAGTWKFEPQSIYVEQAALLGKKLAEHEGYFRENDGSWIVVDENGDRVAAIPFKGTAKRGEKWNAPDPEGQAIARQIVADHNSAPRLRDDREGLLRAAKRILNALGGEEPWEDLDKAIAAAEREP